MNKRICSFILALALLLTLIPAVAAADASVAGLGMRVYGEEYSWSDGTKGIKYSVQLKDSGADPKGNFGDSTGYYLQGVSGIVMEIDKSVLGLASKANGKAIPDNRLAAAYSSAISASILQADPNDEWSETVTISTTGSTAFLNSNSTKQCLYVTMSSGATKVNCDDYRTFLEFYCVFQSGKDTSNLTNKTIGLLSDNTLQAQKVIASKVLIADGTAGRNYGSVIIAEGATQGNADPGSDDLTKSQIVMEYKDITLPGAALKSFAISGDPAILADTVSVNVPTAADVATSANAKNVLKLTVTAEDEDGSSMIVPAGTAWTVYSGAELLNKLTTLPNGVSIVESKSSDQAKANDVATLVIEPNNALSVGTTKYYVVVSNGSISKTVTVDINKNATTATTVKIFDGETEVTGTKEIQKGSSKTYTAKVYDQYGAEMSDQTITWTSSNTAVAENPTNGKVDVKADATANATTTIKAAVGGKDASFTVKVTDVPKTQVTVSGVTVDAKTYDGTTAATINTSNATLSGVVSGDTVAVTVSGTAVFADKNVGTGKSVTGFTVELTGADAYKYELSAQPTLTGTITELEATFAAPSVTAKTYDGTTDATIAATGAVSNAKAGDTVSVSFSNAKYADKNVGTGKTVTYTAALTGTDAGNYKMPATNPAATGDINKATLTLSAKSAVTGELSSSWTISDLATATGLATGDTLDAVIGSLTAGADAFTGKGVTVKFYEKDETAGTYASDATVTLEAGKTYKATIAAADSNSIANYTLATLAETAGVDVKFAEQSNSGVVGTNRVTVTFKAGKHGTFKNGKTTMSDTIKSGATADAPKVIADDGYKFLGWTVNGKKIVDPDDMELSRNTTFTALYEEIGASVSGETYIGGLGNGKFGPQAKATRAQLAAMLARLSKGFDENGSYSGTASDLMSGQWYTTAMQYALETGIMTGYSDGTVRPNQNVTRAEFAAMLARYMGIEEVAEGTFSDVSGWAAGYINALQAKDIVGGYNGKFRPNDELTRAEAVKMINLAVGLKYDAGYDYTTSFTDVARSAWYYEFVIPAANVPISEIIG